jgi:Tannase and feruloyl esterase
LADHRVARAPIVAQAVSDADRKPITDALLQKCDAKDGVADGIISDPLGCDFNPAVDHGFSLGDGLGIETEPDLKSLHGDPRFTALIVETKKRATAATVRFLQQLTGA